MCGICGCGVEDKQHTHGLVDKSDHLQHELESSRLLKIEQDLFAKNNTYAEQNRAYFKQRGIFVLNFLSSPGAGKTTLLVETIKALGDALPIAVIEGDQHTERDAERVRNAGASALQINTGRACHLDAHGIGHAVQDLEIEDNSLLFIENVGNLVCPASFDLGEAYKVVVLSVTEGDDKPLKYPDMFQAADLMLVNKIDLLPYVDFDLEKCCEYAKRINPDIEIMMLSATKGNHFSMWTEWLLKQGRRAS